MSTSTYAAIYLFFAIAVYSGIVFWAYVNKRKRRFEQDGKIPFQDEVRSSGGR